MTRMLRLLDVFTLFIFLIAVISNCVVASQVALDPIAAVLDDSDSANEPDPSKGEDSEVLLADNRSDDTMALIVVKQIVSPISAGRVSHNFATAVVWVIQPKQSTVLRI